MRRRRKRRKRRWRRYIYMGRIESLEGGKVGHDRHKSNRSYLISQHRILEAVRKVLGVLILMMSHVVILVQESVGCACSSTWCRSHNIGDVIQQGRCNRVRRQNQVDGWIQVALSCVHLELDVGDLCRTKQVKQSLGRVGRNQPILIVWKTN